MPSFLLAQGWKQQRTAVERATGHPGQAGIRADAEAAAHGCTTCDLLGYGGYCGVEKCVEAAAHGCRTCDRQHEGRTCESTAGVEIGGRLAPMANVSASTVDMFVKPQYVRLIDVFVLGPMMIYAATALPPRLALLRAGLVVAGIGTVYYNARNYIEVERAAACDPSGTLRRVGWDRLP